MTKSTIAAQQDSVANRNVDRRSLLIGGAATGGLFASGICGCGSAHAQTPASAHRIDVHHHVTPPTWLAAIKKAKFDNPPLANWSPQKSIDEMGKAGVATSMLSPTLPQVNFLPVDEAARIARESNEYSKQLLSDHPGKFGVFAMLPLPHVEASLKEIAYVFDVLKADGIGMLTSYDNNRWLGHPDFIPVLDELNRRKATVYTHPTGAACCVNLVQGVPETVVEYGADTTRTIANLILSGRSQQFPDINFIFSHGGGVLTAVVERLQIQMTTTPPYKDKFTRETMDREIRRFFYDTAQISNAVTLGALAKLVPASQIVYGTDYPYRSPSDHTTGLAGAGFSAADQMAIERDNALRLIPRLRA
jgi:6-methylsalicylate decarboxylase